MTSIGMQVLIITSEIIAITGVFYIVWQELTSKAYCVCGHEFNEHWVVPQGMKNPMGTEKCKLCSCQKFHKSKGDKRNIRR